MKILLFPVRGKIPNALVTPVKKFFENEEIAGLFKIMGYNGYQRNFDPDKFKPSKVVVATDADADGSHIQGLFLILFLKYLPFALNQGKVYCAIPPLYGINVGKGKMKFFADNIEYVEYVQNIYCKDHEIYNIKKKKLTKTEIVRLLYNNIDYLKHLLHVANTYAIDPEFLEFLLYHRKLEFKKFKAEVEKAYRFTKVTKENGIIMIHGLVGALYQTVFFNDRLLNECKEVIKLIERSDEYYIINNQKTTLYGLMKGFSDYEPTGLTRYKGLGKFCSII